MDLMINKITRWILLLIVLAVCVAVAYFTWGKWGHLKTTNRLKLSINTPYFIPVDVIKFTDANIPCITADITGVTLHAKLDLGFSGDLSVPLELLNTLEDKTFLGMRSNVSVFGKEHLSKVYHLPQMKFNQMILSHIWAQELNEELEEDGAFNLDGTKRIPDYCLGSIGWRLFCKVNLFLDCAHAKIAFCDSLNTLREQGYPVEKFVVAPLLLDRGLLEFEAITEKGPLRCVVDTGSTSCCMNIKLPAGKEVVMMRRMVKETHTKILKKYLHSK